MKQDAILFGKKTIFKELNHQQANHQPFLHKVIANLNR